MLGPLEVRRDGVEQVISGAQQRALPGVLLAKANSTVSRDRLIDELFGDEPRENTINSLQAGVSRLRRAIGDGGAILTQSPERKRSPQSLASRPGLPGRRSDTLARQRDRPGRARCRRELDLDRQPTQVERQLPLRAIRRGTIHRVDRATDEIVATVRIGGFPSGIAVGEGAVWVTDADANEVVRIDPESNQVEARIRLGAQPSSIAVGHGGVWVTVR